jgi:hypothetical protein
MRGKEGYAMALPNKQGLSYGAISKTSFIASGDNVNQIFPAAPSAAPSVEASSKAASAFLKSYLRESNTWRGGNTIAEFAETVRMIASPIRSLFSRTETFVGRVGRLRKVYRRDPIDYGKALGDAWLGYHLGISPLMGDLHDAQAAMQALSEGLSGGVTTKRIIGTGQVQTLEGRLLNEPIPGFDYTIRDRETVLYQMVRYLGAMKCQPPGFAAISEEFGIGFSDIIPAVWEAIPWSFIVDYFVNVGEVLDSYKLAWVRFGWLQTTVRNRRVNQYWPLREYSTSSTRDYLVSVQGGQCQTQVTSITRSPQGSPPFPDFQFKIPGTQVQIGNIAALIAGIARSKPPPLFRASAN